MATAAAAPMGAPVIIALAVGLAAPVVEVDWALVIFAMPPVMRREEYFIDSVGRLEVEVEVEVEYEVPL